jgi:hypothetical protein
MREVHCRGNSFIRNARAVRTACGVGLGLANSRTADSQSRGVFVCGFWLGSIIQLPGSVLGALPVGKDK